MEIRGRWGGGVIAALMATALIGAPARAATYSVQVSSNAFTPTDLQAVPGDSILWVWASGPHNVTAYSGASFTSGDQGTNSTHAQTFAGGLVRYRCTRHSTLSGLECTGMCGQIREKPLDVTPPDVSITRPLQGQVLIPAPRVQGGVSNPVTVEGQSSDNVGVLGILLRVYDSTGRANEQPASCTGCPEPNVQWKLELNLLPGSYVAEARATDSSGNIRWSLRTSFYVL